MITPKAKMKPNALSGDPICISSGNSPKLSMIGIMAPMSGPMSANSATMPAKRFQEG